MITWEVQSLHEKGIITANLSEDSEQKVQEIEVITDF